MRTVYFEEFQFAWWILILVPVWSATAIPYFSEPSDISATTFRISTGIFLLLSLLFYGMKTVVDEKQVTVAFGIGLIRKSVKMNNILSATRVRSKWYYGWGIRMIPSGWLFNISGLDGVDIKRKDDTSIIRIGTKQPDILRKAIFEGISKN